MTELVFLLEERSMQEVLQVVVPQLLPEHITPRFIAHEGKNDLQKSIPRKLRAWRTPGVRFVVVQDQDAGDCKAAKRKLVALCKQGSRPDSLVRIVCHHLESWFLGDLAAVEKAFEMTGVAKRQRQRKFSSPDQLPNAAQELRRLVPEYQKVGGSRRIAPYLALGANRSHSFRAFIAGVRGLAGGAASQPIRPTDS